MVVTVGGLGDAVDGDDGVGSGDLDFGNECRNESLADFVGAGGDECGDVIGDLGQCGGIWEGGRRVDDGDQFVASSGELSAGLM
ncbi:hypothetical protein [Nocardia wallacei]|uniref:hypothetical protein n=1 Tax=Nocardia wallacei TaxID=480035 RepID=UPI00245801B8|nr:hypothetical protein [Nocardia wallacei]